MTTASEFAAKIVQGDADLDRLHSAVNDAPGTFTTDEGVSVRNLRGRLDDIGYKVPVAFASGLEPQDGSFTVIYNGERYAADPADTPFTTTGTFNAANWVSLSTPSDLITYNNGGTGAIDTTVKAKLQEFVSVKDFGAIGNGVTDDYSAILNALNALVARGGGTLHFPAGTYITNYAIPLKSNIHYLGDGADATIIKAASTSSDNILGLAYPIAAVAKIARDAGGSITRLRKPDFTTDYTEEEALINGGFAGYAVTHVIIEGITFDGNQAARTLTNTVSGTQSGTFLPWETISNGAGVSAKAAGIFTGSSKLSYEPSTLTGGTFNIGQTLTGAESGATLTITTIDDTDDAYGISVRFDAVSHSTVRNCVFTNSIYTAMSIYNFSNYNVIEHCLFHDNNSATASGTYGFINCFFEFDCNHNTFQDNLVIGGRGYSVLVSCPGGTNRDTSIINNTIYNPYSDGIRVSNDTATTSIFSPKIIGNTVVGCDPANVTGGVGIRLNHGGSSGRITDAIVVGNTVRDGNYGILCQGNIEYATIVGNTARNNANADFSNPFNGTGVSAFANVSDSTVTQISRQKLLISPPSGQSGLGISTGASDNAQLDFAVDTVGTWSLLNNQSDGQFWFNFGGSRKVSMDSSGNLQAIGSVEGGKAKLSGPAGLGTSVSTGATTIYTQANSSASLLLHVVGDDGSNGFNDLVSLAFGVGISVVNSATAYGSPGARTYTFSGDNVQLALASGTLNVRVAAIEHDF